MKARAEKPNLQMIWATSEPMEKLLARDIDWEAFMPELTDDREFDQLISALQAAVARNETLWFMLRALESSGQIGLTVAYKVREMVMN